MVLVSVCKSDGGCCQQLAPFLLASKSRQTGPLRLDAPMAIDNQQPGDTRNTHYSASKPADVWACTIQHVAVVVASNHDDPEDRGR